MPSYIGKSLSIRFLNFSVSVIRFTRKLQNAAEYRIINSQLIKSSTSVGANYREAQSAYSKSDFVYKINIALKEISETSYWLMILYEIQVPIHLRAELFKIIKESEELEKILGSIKIKSRQKQNIT